MFRRALRLKATAPIPHIYPNLGVTIPPASRAPSETTMKTIITLAACALAAVSLSGCALLNAKPADLAPAIDALGRAGCTFNFSISGGAGTASGLSMGAGHAENTFAGGCNPALAHPAELPAPAPVVPLSQIGSILPAPTAPAPTVPVMVPPK